MDVLNNLKVFLNNKTKTTQDPVLTSGALNFDAGADILSRFKNEWEDLHRANEENAASADKASEFIDDLHAFLESKNKQITSINQILASKPNIGSSVENCVKQLNELRDCFENVEKSLLVLEDLVERGELENMKHNHRYQLTLYQEKKMFNLDAFKKELAENHLKEMSNRELKQKQLLQERQSVFQDAFKSDLETYKTLGTIPKIKVNTQSSALLEEIQLDIDDKELNDFLSDN